MSPETRFPGRGGFWNESLVGDLSMRYACAIFGGGWVLVGSPVFKTGGGSRSGPRWVRLPSTPA
jgi:hypothetical protein